MSGLLSVAAGTYGLSIYFDAVQQDEFTKFRFEMPVSDALTVVALAGAVVVALRSWIRRANNDGRPTHGAVQIILLRANLALIAGMLAVIAGFACLVGSAPEGVEIGRMITFVSACVVGLLSVDTAQIVPTQVVVQHRKRSLWYERSNLMRAYLFWSVGYRPRRWFRTVFAIAAVRSAMLAGGAGLIALELVASRDDSWSLGDDVIGELAVLAVSALIVLVLSLLSLKSWALSDWAGLAMTAIMVTLFIGFLTLVSVQTALTGDATTGWAVGAGFLAAFGVVAAQVWLVCKRPRSVPLSWVAPTAFCAVITKRAHHVMKRREYAFRALNDSDAPKSSSAFWKVLREMRGVSSPV